MNTGKTLKTLKKIKLNKNKQKILNVFTKFKIFTIKIYIKI